MIEGCCTSVETAPADLAQLFTFGLLMSAGHCLGMCGPLVCAASLRSREKERATVLTWAAPYHLGRIASYAVMGTGLGALGGLLPDRATAVAWQASVALLAAVAMACVALALLDVVPMARLPFASRVAPWLMRRFGGSADGLAGRMGLGAANGLLPCGPVYTAAAAALVAGSAWRGALAMVAFGAGTLPMLLALAFGARWIGARWRVGLYRVGAALALLMAAQLALRGLAALEVLPHARLREVVLW